MSAYAVGIIAVTVASSLIVTLASGTRFEKICTSVSCIAIALCVISPLSMFLSIDYGDEVTRAYDKIFESSYEASAEEYRKSLEDSLAASVAEAFPSSRVISVDVVLSYGKYELERVNVAVSGVGKERVTEYLSELLHCENISVVILEGENGH